MENYNMGLGDKDNGAQFLSGTVKQQQQLLVWGQRTDVLPFGLVGNKEKGYVIFLHAMASGQCIVSL